MTTKEENENETQYTEPVQSQPTEVLYASPALPPPVYIVNPLPVYISSPPAVQLKTDNKPAKSNQNTHRDFGSHR